MQTLANQGALLASQLSPVCRNALSSAFHPFQCHMENIFSPLLVCVDFLDVSRQPHVLTGIFPLVYITSVARIFLSAEFSTYRAKYFCRK